MLGSSWLTAAAAASLLVNQSIRCRPALAPLLPCPCTAAASRVLLLLPHQVDHVEGLEVCRTVRVCEEQGILGRLGSSACCQPVASLSPAIDRSRQPVAGLPLVQTRRQEQRRLPRHSGVSEKQQTRLSRTAQVELSLSCAPLTASDGARAHEGGTELMRAVLSSRPAAPEACRLCTVSSLLQQADQGAGGNRAEPAGFRQPCQL